ncbi:SixA phosphatase family protein [Eisenibacter elegans]|jgi:phosphohistidine phosphatase|uniref:SixA phosphatase family protein n=1 Tax=Eisenibacter elegans TaxID=997 RepID=UPI0003FC74F9|nr:histidine phosphatase family protein [Eisenibacter elegans]
MKTLYLLRHAKSSWKDSSLDDFYRPLNERGKRDAPFMAQILLQRHPQLDAMIVSPAERTRLTALSFVNVLQLDKTRIHYNDSLYYGTLEDQIQLVSSFPDEWSEALIIGHNPELTQLHNYWSSTPLPNIPTTGLVRLDFQQEHWAALNDQQAANQVFFEFPRRYFPKKIK